MFFMLELPALAGRVSINHTAKHLCEAVTRKSQEDPIYPVLTPHLALQSLRGLWATWAVLWGVS